MLRAAVHMHSLPVKPKYMKKTCRNQSAGTIKSVDKKSEQLLSIVITIPLGLIKEGGGLFCYEYLYFWCELVQRFI